MPTPKRVKSKDKRADVVAAVLAGASYREVSKQFSINIATISEFMRDVPNAPARSQTARAAQARKAHADAQKDFDAAARIRLLNDGFAKAEAMLAQVDQPKDLQLWSISLGILIDKRRLEDGDVTSRTEDVSGQDAYDFITRRIDELAERRRTRAGNPPDVAGASEATAI